MSSPLIQKLNEAGQWEVRINDDSRQLLGTFNDTTSRDIFVEAVLGLVLTGDFDEAAFTRAPGPQPRRQMAA